MMRRKYRRKAFRIRRILMLHTGQKAGNKYVGYVGNIIEDFNGADSVITRYDLQKSTYSDQSFAKDLLDQTAMQERRKEYCL